MDWRGQRQSSNVEDRRGEGGGPSGGLGGGFGGPRIPIGRAGGGLGIGGVVVLLLLAWAAGINPLTLLGFDDGSEISAPSGGSSGSSGQVGVPSDQQGRFVSAVLGSTEDVWTSIFQRAGRQYTAPRLVLFTGQTPSACGLANAAVGPFYCPQDQRVYLDLRFFDELARRFGAPGDFAQAYVIAHEIGHHVQRLTGSLGANGIGPANDNDRSVRTELQADCYAGIWANAAEKAGLVEVGDIDEALNAASQIGDDTLQRKTQGTVVPETFTHGSSAQRSRWFKRGYQSGQMNSCDTFSAGQL